MHLDRIEKFIKSLNYRNNIYYTTYDDALRRHELVNLRDRRHNMIIFDIIQLFKIINSLTDSPSLRIRVFT